MSYYQNNQGGRPEVDPPWEAEWDQRDNCWFYINRQTGERTFEHPQRRGQQQYGGGGYGGQQYGGGQQQYGGRQQQYGGGQQQQYGQQQYGQQQQQQPAHQSHAGRNTAFGVIGGLFAGALAVHEGEKVHERFEEDKYRVENDVRRDERRVDNDIRRDEDRFENGFERDKYRVENDFRRAEDDVVDFPENAARWGGEKVGDVERFDDNVEGAWDQGRDDRRYGDDDNNY